MPKPAAGEKIEMIILSEVRDVGRDKYQYHMISPLRVKVRWIQLNLLPRDRGSQT